VKSRFI